MTQAEYTPIEKIPQYVDELKTTFHLPNSDLNSVQFRLNQLRNIWFALEDNVDDLCDGLLQDFNKPPLETKAMEYWIARAEILDMMKNLSQWLKPDPPASASPLVHWSTHLSVEKIPLGVVLIITPYNYPLVLSISPIIGAIASGNCIVFKPSEMTPVFSKRLTKMLESAIDPRFFKVVNGSVDETTALLKQKFDLVFFTGSAKVGQIVAKAAAETSTPVVLELGGKAPAIVTKDHGDLTTIARRILWGKLSNSGQTCVAVDYILCDEDVKPQLVAELQRIIEEEFLSEGSDYLPHIVSERAFESLQKLLKESKGGPICGGLEACDASKNYIPPTILANVTFDDSTMQQELFGPILPVITYKSLSSSLDTIIERGLDCPLALYIFSENSKEINYIKSRIRSGGVSINECILHVGLPNIPFGGIGQSGYGNYHGKYSIRTFSHERAVLKQPIYTEFLLKMRCPPYQEKKSAMLAKVLDPSPFFKRTGNVPLNYSQSMQLKLSAVAVALVAGIVAWFYSS